MGHLYESVPNFSLGKFGSLLLMVVDFLLQVAALSKLHYDAQRARSLIEKGVFVSDHVLIAKVEKTLS